MTEQQHERYEEGRHAEEGEDVEAHDAATATGADADPAACCGERIARGLLAGEGNPPRRCCGGFDWLLLTLTACGVLLCAPLYDFNVYILPLLDEFYGVDGSTTLTMSNGAPAYVGGLALFFCSVGNFAVGPKMGEFGYRRTYLAGLVVAAAGLVLTFLSVRYGQLWLLYVGYGVVFGTGAGLVYIPLLANMVHWYADRRGKPGLGSGVFGLLPGAWSATFSYWGPPIFESVGVSYSFLVLAGLILAAGLWVPLFLYPPEELAYRNGKVRSSIAAGAARKVNVGPPNARPDNKLSGRELLQTRQFWLIMVLYFLAFCPGFGVKLAVAPLVKGVFDADESEQAAASAMFLGAYGVGRFVFGPLADKVRSRRLIFSMLYLQVGVCAALGAIVWYADEGRTDIWSFTVVGMLLSLALAGVSSVYSVFCLTVFGAPSLGAAMGMLYVGQGLSAFVGPVAMWSVLASSSQNLEGSGGDSTTFTQSVSYFFWAGALATLVAATLLSFVHPHSFHSLEEGGNVSIIRSSKQGGSTDISDQDKC